MPDSEGSGDGLIPSPVVCVRGFGGCCEFLGGADRSSDPQQYQPDQLRVIVVSYAVWVISNPSVVGRSEVLKAGAFARNVVRNVGLGHPAVP